MCNANYSISYDLHPITSLEVYIFEYLQQTCSIPPKSWILWRMWDISAITRNVHALVNCCLQEYFKVRQTIRQTPIYYIVYSLSHTKLHLQPTAKRKSIYMIMVSYSVHWRSVIWAWYSKHIQAHTPHCILLQRYLIYYLLVIEILLDEPSR